MREPNAIIGDNLSPQETNANNGVREQGAERISCCWELSGYLWGEGGGLGKAAPLEVNPGKAAWRSVPRAAGPKREQMTCRRQATRKARQVFGRNYS